MPSYHLWIIYISTQIACSVSIYTLKHAFSKCLKILLRTIKIASIVQVLVEIGVWVEVRISTYKRIGLKIQRTSLLYYYIQSSLSLLYILSIARQQLIFIRKTLQETNFTGQRKNIQFHSKHIRPSSGLQYVCGERKINLFHWSLPHTRGCQKAQYKTNKHNFYKIRQVLQNTVKNNNNNLRRFNIYDG